jgi:hypothetical protein
MTRAAGGTGGDRQILTRLSGRPYGSNDAPTVYYRQGLAGLHPYLLWRFRCAGVDLTRFLPRESIPGDQVWRECAAYDQTQAQGNPAPPTASTLPANGIEFTYTTPLRATSRWGT